MPETSTFSGFYTGMPVEDAQKLATRLGLKFDTLIPEAPLYNDDESAFWVDLETDEVFKMFFTLKDVRQITEGPSTLSELAQTVANQVGDLEPTGLDAWKYETIDGVSLRISKSGCLIHDAPRAAEAREHVVPVLNARMRAKETRKPGETTKITLPGGAEMEMVWCPPGAFWMGSEDEDGRSIGKEQHLVILTEGFWMGKTEVTQAQWKSVLGKNPSHFKGDDLPVELVSWNDCVEFCRKAGNGLQLPTEAQWEYACRAGSTGPFAGGGWCVANSDYHTHPVGQEEANDWGLYDMHGNVEEWCADRDGDYPNHAVQDPQGSSSGSTRVKRGGSWNSIAGGCASSLRYSSYPSYAGYDIGFRLVRTLSE